MNCLTEMYSAIAAEVPIASDPETQKNEGLLKALLAADHVHFIYNTYVIII